MRIVIADDERISRLNLISMIEEFKLNDCSIYECKNGKEMVQTVIDIKPELVFADIRMPLLNGLEAIEECKCIGGKTKYVIISGFSEFEYAKKAIQLGVCEYLLKPFDPIKLNEIINNIIKDNEKELYESNRKFQSNMVELYYNHSCINEELFNQLYSKRNFTICSFYLDNDLDTAKLTEMKMSLIKKEETIIKEMLFENINIAKLNTEHNFTTFIFSYSSENYCKVNKYIKKIIYEYKNYNSKSYLTTVTGNTLKSTKMICSEIDRLNKYGSLRIVFGIDKNYSIDELINYRNAQSHYLLSNVIENIIISIKNNIYVMFCDYLEKLEQLLVNDKAILKDQCIYNNINLFLKKTINFDYKDRYSSEWISEFYQFKEKFLKDLNKNKDISEQIMEFINQNYMYDISITSISKMFNLTPNYISSLFHRKTNIKLFDYVAKVRISKSQRLLAETDLNIDDISKAVGYYSSSHFTKLFKSLVGLSPSEYRKSLR